MTLSFKNIKKYGWLFACSFSLLIIGCQKIINVDLNSASPTIVIVGNINDLPGPYTVTLTQTVNFSDPNTFPPVSGARVIIADNTGITDTLVETIPGTYHTQKTVGVVGRTYILSVTSGGQSYIATSTMPQVVTFDTLQVVQRDGFRDTALFPEAGFRDPPSGSHYYRFVETRNDSLKTRVFVFDDEFSSGVYVNYPLRSDTGLAVGDSDKVEMQCIDKGTFQYLSTFYVASGSSVNVTPSNPISTFSNNALGYFSAHTSRYRSLKVQ